jgi:hypothetical protein
MSMSKIRSIVWGAVALALLAGSPALAVDVIQKGVDVWTTVQGFTQTSFESDPIPAGFFCEGSKPFDGKIVFRGEPLASNAADTLGPVDTVVSRLDDAVFNEKGEATTRIQLMALSLASTRPLETGCGKYNVAVSLAGEQPKTTMKIVRTEERGGRYEAPLALNVKMTFTPVDGKGSPRELTRKVNLGPGTNSVWSYSDKPRYAGPIFIDTDGNGKPDTQVRGSKFIAGQAPVPGTVAFASYTTYSTQPSCPPGTCPKQSCHCNPDEDSWDPNETRDGCSDDHLHCVWVCVQAPSGTGTGSGGSLGSGTFNGTEPDPDISYACAEVIDAP